jgi:uncharacterized protein YlzI (FlbEa/FlbD family)
MTKVNRTLFLHIIGSLAFLSIPILSSPDFNTGQNLFTINPFLQNFSRTLFLLFFFYLNYYVFLPKLYFSNKKLYFFITILLCFLLIYTVSNLLFPFDFQPKMNNGNKPPIKPNQFFHFFESGFFQFIIVVTLSYLLKINQRFETIKQEKQLAEISYLKAQINPHFLFNTLNSLYALTITKSDEAPNAILKLSNMMRYVVTESSQDFVPLSKEINYIKDYIALQKLRMNEDVNFSFNYKGDEVGKSIAPLIIIPFIENAFKYGLNPDEESEIRIEIAVVEFNLTLISKNKMVVHELSEDLKTETGIENTKKRLEFIYPNKHLLEISEIENKFNIRLNINLA